METFQAIEERRSIKHYDPDHTMTQDEINTLMQAAMLTPTSFNCQHYRFVVATDPTLRQKMREASWNQAQVTDSSATIIVCADTKAWSREPSRYWRNAPEDVQKFLVPMITGFYEKNSEMQRDEALRSASMASQTIMLAAKDMGYDTCAMVGFDFAKMAELIKLPEDHIICMMITVGKAKEQARERSGQITLEEAVFMDTF